MDDNPEPLDSLLGRLEDNRLQGRPPDAIDDILAAKPREARPDSLRTHRAVKRFRKELADGLVAADTVNQLLRLIRTALEKGPS